MAEFNTADVRLRAGFPTDAGVSDELAAIRTAIDQMTVSVEAIVFARLMARFFPPLPEEDLGDPNRGGDNG